MSNDAKRLNRRRFVALSAGAAALTTVGLPSGVGAAAAQPTTFKAVVGWERRRGADRSNLEGGALRE